MQASVDLGGRRIIKKKIFFKQKTAYEIGGSDWSSDVCSSDLSYLDMLAQSGLHYKNPELMLFTIIELVGSTCYSCILDLGVDGIVLDLSVAQYTNE